MSFRKRNIGLSHGTGVHTQGNTPFQRDDGDAAQQPPNMSRRPAVVGGVRSSPADGRPTTSTGTHSLDELLAGHVGLALGNSMVVQETGTTDYAGALLRCFAAEGIVQGHTIHLLGAGHGWIKDLPGIARNRTGSDVSQGREQSPRDTEKMKIAWRYEQFSPRPNREVQSEQGNQSRSKNIGATSATPFCHTFDLTKRLDIPTNAHIDHYALSTAPQTPSESPYADFLQSLHKNLSQPIQNSIHRIIIPSLLSPLLYPTHANEPQHLLRFLHTLRSLLRKYSNQLSLMISFPLTLYPRATGVARLIEHLVDGVIELAPFPFRADDYSQNGVGTSGAATANEERPQGLVKIHKLPVFHEKAGGGGGIKGLGDDLAFTVSRRRFAIRPFSLPPEEGDQEAQAAANLDGAGMPAKEKMEF